MVNGHFRYELCDQGTAFFLQWIELGVNSSVKLQLRSTLFI